MKTIRLLSIIAAFAVISLTACGDDDPAKPQKLPPSQYKNLTERAHVLDNLELSYVQRNLEKYEELLDDDFTFYLSAGDVGGEIPGQWDRSVEVAAHTNLFDSNYIGTMPACESIQLDVRIEDGVTWVESDSPTTPSEKWYVATLSYDFRFEMEGDYHLLNNPGSKARFTVRNAGTGDSPQWRLVEMRDLADEGLVAASATATEQSSWGQVKAIYREPPQEPQFQDLSEKWHVLNNIEMAYTDRNIDRYDQVLDNDFTFFLSTGDVGGGLPEFWDRVVELQANTNLLSTNQPPAPLHRVLSIQMDIDWEDGQGDPNIAWIEITPPNSSETWYTTTVRYDFKFDDEDDLSYINNPGALAQFTVRNAGTDIAPQWRLVEMRDLSPPNLVAVASTESKTWGGVKAMYREPPQGPQFEDLSEMWHVLHNIEMAYTDRNIARYDQVLDNNFTFFLSASDVGVGLPDSWGRDVEVQANTNLFSTDQPPPPRKRVLSIQMDVAWEDDQGNPNVAWIAFTPPNSSETWYATTVKYDFKIDVEGDLTYINNPGSQAQFTVRNAGTGDAPQWRLVEMRDLGSEYLVAGLSASTEQSTWGSVKYLYR